MPVLPVRGTPRVAGRRVEARPCGGEKRVPLLGDVTAVAGEEAGLVQHESP